MEPGIRRRARGPVPPVRVGRQVGVRAARRGRARRRGAVGWRDDPLRGAGLPALDADPRGGAVLVNAFDVCGPLPTGTTVLEASAGTGKTFTIAALTARY